jgi:hypothetical protein
VPDGLLKTGWRVSYDGERRQTGQGFQSHIGGIGNTVASRGNNSGCSAFRDGAGRTGIWTKAKCRATQHAVVGGWTVSPKGFSGLLSWRLQGKKLIPIGRLGTGFPQKLLRWLEPRLKQLETNVSLFAGPIARKPGRIIQWAKPELVAGIEMTS